MEEVAQGGIPGPRVQVVLPYALRPYAAGQERVEVVASDLARAIAELNRRFPGLAYRILDDAEGLRRFVQAFVNDEPVSHLPPREVRLREGDTVTILPSIAGG